MPVLLIIHDIWSRIKYTQIRLKFKSPKKSRINGNVVIEWWKKQGNWQSITNCSNDAVSRSTIHPEKLSIRFELIENSKFECLKISSNLYQIIGDYTMNFTKNVKRLKFRFFAIFFSVLVRNSDSEPLIILYAVNNKINWNQFIRTHFTGMFFRSSQSITPNVFFLLFEVIVCTEQKLVQNND